jgi:hypothetical protein
MRFQDLWLLQRLASWAIDPWFRGFVNEGREDVDTFRYEDDTHRAYRIVRWQLKDRLVTRALLADVLAGFYAQHRERDAHQATPIHQFYLVAPAAQEDVWTLPDLIERVRHAHVAYGPKALEYSASLEDLSRRLEKLRVPVDETFVSERVHLDFRAGWAQFDEHYWKTLQALLQALDVPSDRARDAANHLFTIVSGQVGELIAREAILESLKSFQRQQEAPSRPAKAPEGANNVRSQKAGVRSNNASSHCLISYFPDEAVLLEFPDGACGLIDCGPAAIRHIVQYLSDRSIKALSFLALSHWHNTHYAGVPALLNAVSRIENVFLNLDANPNAVIPRRSRFRQEGLMSKTAKEVVDRLVTRVERDGGQVYFNSGLHWIYRDNRDSASDFVCGFAPEVGEYHLATDADLNNLSAVFLARIAGRQFLLGGHAFVRRWQHVLRTADAADVEIRADGFLLPHYASRSSLTPAVIKSLVNRDGFIGLLPTSDWMTKRFGQITNRAVLDALRAAGGRLVVCDSTEPTHFAMTREGLFQSLSPRHL